MKFKRWGMFLASAIVGGAVVLPLSADAFQRRVHASSCFFTGNWEAQGGSTAGIKNISGANKVVQCPVPDDDSLLPQSLNFVNVHGSNASGGVFVGVTACVHFWDTPGGTCQFTSQTSAAGRFVLSPAHETVWAAANFNHFHYLNVIMPANSFLAGYFLSP